MTRTRFLTVTAFIMVVGLCGGCASPEWGWTYRATPQHFEPTSIDDVRVLDEIPPGAIVVGEVSDLSEEKARHRAAEIGAEAIVVTMAGFRNVVADRHYVSSFVQATAIRLSK